MRHLPKLCVFLLLTGAASAPLKAVDSRESLVVSTAWLAQHLGDANLVLLHLGNPGDFAAKHIPGARIVVRSDFSISNVDGGLTLELPAPEVLRQKLEGLGISDNSRVIVSYSANALSQATRVILTLDAAGLGAQTSVLDGGQTAWEAEKRATTAEASAPKAGKLSPLKMKPPIVDADFVKAHLTDPKYVIIDARDKAFYDGTQTGGSGPTPHKTGHIAGAKNIPYSSLTSPDQLLKPAADLRAMFDQAGVKPGDEVVAYCHIGQQATAVVFAARTLGISIKLYDGSFEDWSKKDGPVEKTIK